MYPYILCVCGRSLGEHYDLFKEKRRAIYVEAFGDHVFDPTMLAIIDKLGVDFSSVFEDLHLTTECCKVKMMTQVEFKDIY